MKMTIKYSYNLSIYPHYFAETTRADGEFVCSTGQNWDDAKKNLLEKLRSVPPTVPDPEEVEI